VQRVLFVLHIDNHCTLSADESACCSACMPVPVAVSATCFTSERGRLSCVESCFGADLLRVLSVWGLTKAAVTADISTRMSCAGGPAGIKQQ
jgi:hypothetical protein